MTTDTLDELAAFGHPAENGASARALIDLVERSPVAAVLGAAAAGAGLMALVSLMARGDPAPRAPAPAAALPAFEHAALKAQIADLADRLARAVPLDATKQRVEHDSDAIADGWGAVRDQALGALGRFEPRASAVLKVARENPVWTALIAGAVGALVGSKLLGKPSTEATEPQSDPSADA